MRSLNQLTVIEASKLIESGEITPVELVSDCLARIKEIDDKILAWTVVDEESAMETAESLTEEVQAGHIRGPLHGIPIGIKDIFDVAGLPTRAGSEIYENADPAARDSSIVAEFRELGAIVIGKTHTTKFAFYDPAPTRNPYNLAHTPGGSSSGSAAAIPADMALLTLGSQTNASVCRPGAYSGAASFKPTKGRVKMDRVTPLAPSFDSPGLFGHTVLDLIAGSQALLNEPVCNFDHLLSQSFGDSDCKIGIVSDPIYLEASSDLKKVQKQTMKRLEANRYEMVEVKAPCAFNDLIEDHQIVMAYEAAKHYRALVEKHSIGGKFGELVEEGHRISNQAYQKAVDNIHHAKREMQKVFDSFDVLLVPPTDTAAPECLDSTGNPKFTTPWTVFGGPLIVIPAELDSKGLPLSMMFASAPGTDLDLIKKCIPIERIMGTLPKPALDYSLC